MPMNSGPKGAPMMWDRFFHQRRGEVECLECEAKGRVRKSEFPDEDYRIIVWKRWGSPRYAERWSSKTTFPLICEKCRVLQEKVDVTRRAIEELN